MVNQRVIKFRAKLVKTGEWIYFTLRDLEGGLLINNQFIWNTVCEYTNLKDKNGKEIYLADILRDNAEQIYEIKWLKEQGQICAIRVDSELSGWPRHFRDIQFMEVIGNIYENKDLLKLN